MGAMEFVPGASTQVAGGANGAAYSVMVGKCVDAAAHKRLGGVRATRGRMECVVTAYLSL